MRGRRGKAARTPVACEKLLGLAVPRETLRLRVRLLAELAPGSRRDPQRRCADSGDPRHRLQLQGRRAGEHEKRQEDARKSHAISSGKLSAALCWRVFSTRLLLFGNAGRLSKVYHPNAKSARSSRGPFVALRRCCRDHGSRLSCSSLLHLAHTCCLHSVRPNARCCPRQHSGTVQWLLALTRSRLPTRWRT